MISNSVTHLRSYTNFAIADIAENSAPILPVTLRDRRRLRIERRYRRIEWRMFCNNRTCPVSVHCHATVGAQSAEYVKYSKIFGYYFWLIFIPTEDLGDPFLLIYAYWRSCRFYAYWRSWQLNASMATHSCWGAWGGPPTTSRFTPRNAGLLDGVNIGPPTWTRVMLG